MAECVHVIPGRARFRIPALRHSETVAEALRRRLSAMAGIHQVEIRRCSASIIIRFDPHLLDAAGLQASLMGEAAIAAPTTRPGAGSRPLAAPPSLTPTDNAPSTSRRLVRHVSSVAGAAALNVVLERAVKAGIGLLLRSARIPI